MIGLMLRLALIFVLLGTIALGATHARFADSSRIVLFPPSPGCNGDSVCFMGIRPGATSLSDAITLLKAHPWVANVDTRPSISQASWTWSGAQPDYIDTSVPGMIIERDYTAVSQLRFGTRYRYGDVWFQLGAAEIGYSGRTPDTLVHGMYYPAYSLLAISITPCPAHPSDFWLTPMIFQFGDAYLLLDQRYAQDSLQWRSC